MGGLGGYLPKMNVGAKPLQTFNISVTGVAETSTKSENFLPKQNKSRNPLL